MQKAEFRRPAGLVIAAIGALIVLAGAAGLVAVLLVGGFSEPKTAGLTLAGFAGASALGAGFINTWRTPMLTVRPDALVVPSFFGAREIPIAPGHPVGEFLGPSDRGGSGSVGRIADSHFVHFYTLDAAGRPTELAAFHRAAPVIPRIRRALEEVAGLTVETLERDPNRRTSRPDLRHWMARRT